VTSYVDHDPEMSESPDDSGEGGMKDTLKSFGTRLQSQGRFFAVYLGIAAIVIPTWAAIYYGQSGDDNAASSLKVAQEQLFYQQADEMKGLSPIPIETTDPAGIAFEISGQHVYRKVPSLQLRNPASGPGSEPSRTESTQPPTQTQLPSQSRSPEPPAAAFPPPIAAEPQSNFWHSIWPFVILGAIISLVATLLAIHVLPRGVTH